MNLCVRYDWLPSAAPLCAGNPDVHLLPLGPSLHAASGPEAGRATLGSLPGPSYNLRTKDAAGSEPKESDVPQAGAAGRSRKRAPPGQSNTAPEASGSGRITRQRSQGMAPRPAPSLDTEMSQQASDSS